MRDAAKKPINTTPYEPPIWANQATSAGTSDRCGAAEAKNTNQNPTKPADSHPPEKSQGINLGMGPWIQH
jgi:hypothetical protein